MENPKEAEPGWIQLQLQLRGHSLPGGCPETSPCSCFRSWEPKLFPKAFFFFFPLEVAGKLMGRDQVTADPGGSTRSSDFPARGLSESSTPRASSCLSRLYLDPGSLGDRDLPHAVEAVEVGLGEAGGQDGSLPLRQVPPARHCKEESAVGKRKELALC